MLVVGGRRVIDGTLTTGEFAAFYTYVLMLAGPMRMLGVALGMSQRAVASGAPAVRDPRPRAAARRSRTACRALPAGGGRVELDDVSFTFPGAREPRCATSA